MLNTKTASTGIICLLSPTITELSQCERTPTIANICGQTSDLRLCDVNRLIQTLTNALKRPHNPKVGGSNPSPATKKRRSEA